MLIVPQGGIDLELLPDRAVYWSSQRTVLLADLHLGRGVPHVRHIQQTVQQTLTRAQQLLARMQPERVVFLGDVFHMRHGYASDVVDAFAQWRASFAQIDMWLIRGNHERGMGDPPRDCGLQCMNPGYELAEVTLLHEPRATPGFAISGHLHPCMLLPSERAVAETVPCFIWSQKYLMLPAFEDVVPGRVVARRTNESYVAIRNHSLVTIS